MVAPLFHPAEAVEFPSELEALRDAITTIQHFALLLHNEGTEIMRTRSCVLDEKAKRYSAIYHEAIAKASA